MSKDRDVNLPDVSKMRMKELQKLTSIADSYQGNANAGDLKAASLLLSISERISKLLGLDAPSQSKIEITSYDGGAIDENVRQLLESINSKRKS